MRLRLNKRARSASLAVAVAACLVAPGSAQAADAVQTWNNTLLTVIRETSGIVFDGPPEVARQMAIVGTAMSNAAIIAEATPNADINAAINAAGYTAMMALFTPHNTAGNPNTGNLTTVGELWGGLSTLLGSQINAAYGAAGDAVSTAIGVQAAADIIQARTGSLTASTVSIVTNPDLTSSVASDTSDGSFAAIQLSRNAKNYVPKNYAASQLAPGADANTGVGVYVPLPDLTPPGHIAIVPTWSGVSTLSTNGTSINTDFPGLSPPDVTSKTYADSLMQTYCTGGTSTQANFAAVCLAAGIVINPADTVGLNNVSLKNNALFWNDPGTTIQPPGHWLDITDTVMLNAATAGMPLSLVQEARLTSLMGQAELAAGIAAWNQKYDYNLWRPTTAITGINGATIPNPPGSPTALSCQYGNWNATLNGTYGFTCDPTWKSVIATPPHPDYVAGHPAFSGAAATVLTNFFGTSSPGFEFSTSSDAYCNGSAATQDLTGIVIACANPLTFVGAITETFDDFLDASDAATTSRVNGGIHTDFAVVDALAIGKRIGDEVFQASIPEPASFILLGAGLIGLAASRRRSA